MINIRVNFRDDCNAIYTRFSGTMQQAMDYYVGKYFTFDNFGAEEKHMATSVTLITTGVVTND